MERGRERERNTKPGNCIRKEKETLLNQESVVTVEIVSLRNYSLRKQGSFFYLGNMNKKRHTKRHIFQRTALFLVWSLRKINRMLINSVDYS